MPADLFVTPLELIAAFALGYLAGSLSSAVLVARACGLPDPRTIGSGNPGATNMLRHAGRKIAAIVLVLDMLKGLLPPLAMAWFSGDSTQVAVCAIAACVGHMWPVFFGLRGGKAVATYAGTCFAMSPWLGLGFALVWLSTLRISRVSSLGALVACLTAPPWAWTLGLDAPVIGATALLSSLVIARHHGNIRRLLRGEEGRVGR